MLDIKTSNRNQVRKHVEDNGIAILPVGACEQHGPHLPLGTDVFLADSFSREIAKRIGAAIYPPLEFGYSWVWRNTPGTVTLSQEVFKNTLAEAIKSLEKSGYKLIIVVNGHDSNKMAIKYVLREIADSCKVKVLNFFYPGMTEAYENHLESPTWYGMFHAEEFETSLMLHFRPDLVNMELAVKDYPERPVTYGFDYSPLDFISKSGVYGDATLASAEKGKLVINEIIEKSISIINNVLKD